MRGESDTDQAAREAVAEVRAGNLDAFAEVVQLYQSRVTSLALALVRDPTAAREVAQDAFVRVYRYLSSYNAERPFYPWMAKIATRAAQDRLRANQRARATQPLEEDDLGEPVDNRAHPMEVLMREQQAHDLWRAVGELPVGQRLAVVLYQQGLDVQEVAKALGVTAGTVKTQLHRARKRLQERLGAERRE